MHKSIQVGNLGYSMDDDDLARLFSAHGVVRRATISVHIGTGQSAGVGFVEMESDKESEAAISALNGHEHCGRVLTVCWSNRSEMPAAVHGPMFGPMEIIDGDAPSGESPEQRGLR